MVELLVPSVAMTVMRVVPDAFVTGDIVIQRFASLPSNTILVFVTTVVTLEVAVRVRRAA